MKALLKTVLIKVYMALPQQIRTWLWRDKITILLYHEISADLFDSHLNFLKKKYTIISLERFKQVLYAENNEKLPPNPLIITFDDGWKSNFQLLPVIKKHGVPVTIFISTGLVGSCRKIWNYTLDRKGTESEINNHLKNVPNKDKNRFLLSHNGYFPEKEYGDRDFLSIDEMKSMAPYVDFQSHGHFHPVMQMCDDNELRIEMKKSKQFIESTFENTCYAIAYPYGLFDNRVADIAKDEGYFICRLTVARINSLLVEPCRLNSIGVDEWTNCKKLNEKIAWAQVCTWFRRGDAR
jgi:peptidoglycan/xylan/chitin deacetylase (PgdA/CDA1 family)